jgi:two-component SAPR family response regulator
VISKDTGAWQFHCNNEPVYIDYQVFVQLVQEQHPADKHYMQQMVATTSPGAFLQQTEYNWLDDIKSEVSSAMLDRCLTYINSTHAIGDPEFIIEICNAIFQFDRLNEDALTFKCKSLISLKRHALANNTYLSFAKEYKEIYGEDFPRTYNEIIK